MTDLVAAPNRAAPALTDVIPITDSAEAVGWNNITLAQLQAFIAGGSLLGYAYANTALAKPSAGASAIITGMSVTFNMPVDGIVLLEWHMLLYRVNGAVRITPFLDGAAFGGMVSGNQFYSLYQGESGIHQANGGVAIPVTAGNRTIALYYNDAMSNQPVEFENRIMTVRRLV